jgi:hypothetical protein
MTKRDGRQLSRAPRRTGSATSARVLFEDFDGVLHPTLARDATPWDEALVSTKHFGWVPALEGALRGHPDVRVVVHSTWRYKYDLEELRGVLGGLACRVIASTRSDLPRYDSIVDWLQQNPWCTDYRILDDDANEFPRPLPRELIVCNPLTGVSAPEVLRALADWLGPPKN